VQVEHREAALGGDEDVVGAEVGQVEPGGEQAAGVPRGA
jgi:hypothetical protein